MKEVQLVPSDLIENRIFLVRGQRVMIDRDIAHLYGVETKYLNRQVKRNRDRFPREFMFKLTNGERDELVTNWHRFASLKRSTVLVHAFTEHSSAPNGAVHFKCIHVERSMHSAVGADYL